MLLRKRIIVHIPLFLLLMLLMLLWLLFLRLLLLLLLLLLPLLLLLLLLPLLLLLLLLPIPLVHLVLGDNVLQVDGGGVQAAVVEANVGASNGVIHSIDRVGGVL